jgi:hypothetical protein
MDTAAKQGDDCYSCSDDSEICHGGDVKSAANSEKSTLISTNFFLESFYVFEQPPCV